MKHASATSLTELAPLLEKLRSLTPLTERKTGTFYLHSTAFLHFHEDPLGLFADLKLDGVVFERFAVNSTTEQEALFQLAKKALANGRQSARASKRAARSHRTRPIARGNPGSPGQSQAQRSGKFLHAVSRRYLACPTQVATRGWKSQSGLIALVAKHFGCAKSAVSIKSGASGRLKLVQVQL
jgi:hypothetical protein